MNNEPENNINADDAEGHKFHGVIKPATPSGETDVNADDTEGNRLRVSHVDPAAADDAEGHLNRHG
jgi:hypothetical protein